MTVWHWERSPTAPEHRWARAFTAPVRQFGSSLITIDSDILIISKHWKDDKWIIYRAEYKLGFVATVQDRMKRSPFIDTKMA